MKKLAFGLLSLSILFPVLNFADTCSQTPIQVSNVQELYNAIVSHQGTSSCPITIHLMSGSYNTYELKTVGILSVPSYFILQGDAFSNPTIEGQIELAPNTILNNLTVEHGEKFGYADDNAPVIFSGAAALNHVTVIQADQQINDPLFGFAPIPKSAITIRVANSTLKGLNLNQNDYLIYRGSSPAWHQVNLVLQNDAITDSIKTSYTTSSAAVLLGCFSINAQGLGAFPIINGTV